MIKSEKQQYSPQHVCNTRGLMMIHRTRQPVTYIKLYARGWGCLVQLCANPWHSQSETHLNESQPHRPSFFTHFLCISKSRSTRPVQTAPAPLLFSIPLALLHHQDKTVWQSQKLFLLCFPSQLEQRPGWHVTDSILGNGPQNVGD